MSAILRLALGFGAAVTVAGIATSAHAQPDPFADYEAAKRGEPAPCAVPAPPAELVLPVAKKSLALGVRSAFAYSTTSADSLSGPQENNSTLFLRLAPAIEYHIKDRLVLGASFGLIQKSIGREAGSGGRSETGWMPEISAQYDLPITSRVALMPGMAFGVYFGGSTRQLILPTSTTPVEESTSTVGVGVTVAMRVGFQVSEHIQVRSGLGLFGTFGSEKISSANTSLGTSSFNFTLPVEVYYTF